MPPPQAARTEAARIETQRIDMRGAEAAGYSDPAEPTGPFLVAEAP